VPNSNRKPPASSNEPDPPLSSTLGRALPPEQRQRLQAAAGDAAASRLRAYHDQHGHEPNEVVHSDQKRAKDRAREARQQKRRKAAGRKAASETPLPLDLDSPDLQRTAQEFVTAMLLQRGHGPSPSDLAQHLHSECELTCGDGQNAETRRQIRKRHRDDIHNGLYRRGLIKFGASRGVLEHGDGRPVPPKKRRRPRGRSDDSGHSSRR